MTTKQYNSAKPFWSGAAPANVVGDDDIARLRSYDFYEDAYHNRPETFQVTLRGDDDEEQVPIYLPAAKKIIEATNRFLAVDFDFVVDPNSGDSAAQETMRLAVTNLFKREQLHAKFANNRRYGLIRGDAIFHITADDSKPEGQRISIHEVDPRNYFVIPDAFDANRIAGVYLVDIVQDPRAKDDKTKQVSRVQKYLRTQDTLGGFTGEILSSLELFEIGKWDERTLKPSDIKKVSTLRPPTALDPRITSIPVYHWRNNTIPGFTFGNSQVSGIESLINGINQSITDQDLTLVMQGLGMYWTNAAPPQDENGNDTDWQIGPRAVIEVGDQQTFGRVTGVSTVAPYLDHIKYLDAQAQEGTGVPDIAVGKVDVAVAESGISLQLQLAPILAANAEKELEILGKTDQMLYDLTHMWYPAYEGLDFPEVQVSTVIGDAMPQNREAAINEILGLVSNLPPLITIAQAQAKLAKWGYEFNLGDDTKVIQEAEALAAQQDTYGNRYAQELEDGAAE